MNSITNQGPTINPLNPIVPNIDSVNPVRPITNSLNNIGLTNSRLSTSIPTNPVPPFQPHVALAEFGTARRGRRRQPIKFRVLLADTNGAPQLVRQHGPLRQLLQNNNQISHEIIIFPNTTPRMIDDMVKPTFIVLRNGWTILKWQQRTRRYIEIEQPQGGYTFNDVKG